jgi:hypothetical protein
MSIQDFIGKGLWQALRERAAFHLGQAFEGTWADNERHLAAAKTYLDAARVIEGAI